MRENPRVSEEAVTKTILIVEDEPDLAGLLRDVLIDGGFHVVLSTGTAARSTAADLAPDAIVIDYVMPGRNGGQVIDEIRGTVEKMPPIILVTGREEAADLARELRADAFLRKPFDVADLAQLARSLTGDA
jgi:DNA-binding response OmpR family regulator